MVPASCVTYTVDGHVARISLNHPPLNLLNRSVLTDFARVLDLLSHEHVVKAAVLLAEGRVFSAGADIREIASLQDVSEREAFAAAGQAVMESVRAGDEVRDLQHHGGRPVARGQAVRGTLPYG